MLGRRIRIWTKRTTFKYISCSTDRADSQYSKLQYSTERREFGQDEFLGSVLHFQLSFVTAQEELKKWKGFFFVVVLLLLLTVTMTIESKGDVTSEPNDDDEDHC